ncbi:hypothetical protein RI054_32g127660 [Pseudoscourfieldia marina]
MFRPACSSRSQVNLQLGHVNVKEPPSFSLMKPQAPHVTDVKCSPTVTTSFPIITALSCRSYESSDGSKRAYTKIPEGIVQVIALKLYMDAREVVLATFGVDLDKKRELLRGVQLDFSLLYQADPGEGKRYVRVLKEETPIEDCANKKEWEQLNTLDGKGGFIPLSALDDTGTVLAGVDSDPPSPDLVGRR